MNLRQFLPLSAAAAAAGVGAYTWQVEPHWVEVVERDLPIGGLPPELAGARMVQISDLHVGPRVSDEYLIDRGLGHLLQVRFNVRPEITSFTLRGL